VKLSSWGRLSNDEQDVRSLRHIDQVQREIRRNSGIAYGMGRSYGDVCLNPDGIVWNTSNLNKFIAFDEESGQLTCEAGVLLRDIQRLMLPRGWTLPVTPGTQVVTVGGAIANDIHGKSHHAHGTFGNHVVALTLIRTDGEVIECGPRTKPAWFAATVGGIGLTGVIASATLQLQRSAGPWIETETVAFKTVDSFFELSATSDKTWENSVSWIDCTGKNPGRGLFMRGNPVASTRPMKQGGALTVPFVPPISLVNKITLKAFNTAYFYGNQIRKGKHVVGNEKFFYPLDGILEWNRIYGPRGFYQYQSVIPVADSVEVTKEMLNVISRSGQGSFLAVLKTFGDIKSPGLLSFPMPGVTLALDFPNKGESTVKLLEELDKVVLQAGGRLYLAKDARMSPEMFEAGYPNLKKFARYRDPGMSSALSRRLLGM